MRGYAVFSPIQDEVILEITISKASIYRLLLHLMNPTTVDIGAEIIITPTYTHTQGKILKFLPRAYFVISY